MENTAHAETCTLDPGALGDHIDAWRQLTALALHREAHPGRVVSTYPRSPYTTARLNHLVNAERECCSFLKFDMREEKDVVTVELHYPPEFAPLLAAVLP